jgi:hypothetical protein
MISLVNVAVGLSLAAFALYFRAAVVSLNRDMRAILDGQAGIRARLDALEAKNEENEHG